MSAEFYTVLVAAAVTFVAAGGVGRAFVSVRPALVTAFVSDCSRGGSQVPDGRLTLAVCRRDRDILYRHVTLLIQNMAACAQECVLLCTEGHETFVEDITQSENVRVQVCVGVWVGPATDQSCLFIPIKCSHVSISNYRLRH